MRFARTQRSRWSARYDAQRSDNDHGRSDTRCRNGPLSARIALIVSGGEPAGYLVRHYRTEFYETCPKFGLLLKNYTNFEVHGFSGVSSKPSGKDDDLLHSHSEKFTPLVAQSGNHHHTQIIETTTESAEYSKCHFGENRNFQQNVYYSHIDVRWKCLPSSLKTHGKMATVDCSRVLTCKVF